MNVLNSRTVLVHESGMAGGELRSVLHVQADNNLYGPVFFSAGLSSFPAVRQEGQGRLC